MIDLKKTTSTTTATTTNTSTTTIINNNCTNEQLNDSLNNSKNSTNSFSLLESLTATCATPLAQQSPLYETSQLYCDKCEYSCDLANKQTLVNHFIDKHFSHLNGISYNYLLSQLLLNDTDDESSSHLTKKKYFLIRASLNLKYKTHETDQSTQLYDENTALEDDAKYILFKICNKVILENIIDDIEEEQQLYEFTSDDFDSDTDYDSFKDNNDLLIQNLLQNKQVISSTSAKRLSKQESTEKLLNLNGNTSGCLDATQAILLTQQSHDQNVSQCEESGENLFIFKCNLCDSYNTDDLTQLIEHYKLLHDVELSVSDSSILLTAAIAAFQTGHTIEMTGAILNTLSTITNENGITIINGEELAVHTTVQYKCTICFEIFYEKVYIVQHLREMHQFEVDISYFEMIEQQQQEQLQQKLYEQEQEQLQFQQLAQQQQQQQSESQHNTTKIDPEHTSIQSLAPALTSSQSYVSPTQISVEPSPPPPPPPSIEIPQSTLAQIKIQEQHLPPAQQSTPPPPPPPPPPQSAVVAPKRTTHKKKKDNLTEQQQELINQIANGSLLNEITEITTLTLDSNNQILIDFNENDDLQCVYCPDYVATNLNFIRTHIKYKHKDKKIIFKNKKNLKFYTMLNEPAQSLPNGLTNGSKNSEIDVNEALKALNVTLNCHYCWAQFQLNASKNPKENLSNKFMQHLSLHLNAPYLCGECSYPVKDLKTFLKHKEFYKHDETAAAAATTVSTQTANIKKCDMIENKIFKYLLSNNHTKTCLFKCACCKRSSNDKDELLKHILIVHLSFLAYKCDLCTSYFAFDELQIRSHTQLIHGIKHEIKSKLIKTEDEISLALNKANQLILSTATNESDVFKARIKVENDLEQVSNELALCDVRPKYKCCKCSTDSLQSQKMYSYQEALEHLARSHLLKQTKIDLSKKVCFELELLEDNLETLKDKVQHQSFSLKRKLSEVYDNDTQEASFYYEYDDFELGDCEGYHGVVNDRSGRTFFYKTKLLFKCKLCERRMCSFSMDHWLQLHMDDININTLLKTSMNIQADFRAKQFTNLYDFYLFLKNKFMNKSKCVTSNRSPATQMMTNCFICSYEVKLNTLKDHLHKDHGLSEFDTSFINEFELTLIQLLQNVNLVQIYESVRVPTLRVPSCLRIASQEALVKFQTEIVNEIKKLKEIYRQQIVEKSILSWINIDQLIVRHLSYCHSMCSICGMTKERIVKVYSPLLHDDTNQVWLILANHILAHFNEYCYRCIACKISWPDRTQLLKHSHECPNSQVVRTKTKYKLKANARNFLQFNLLTLIEYWSSELDRLNEILDKNRYHTTTTPSKFLQCLVHVQDLFSKNNRVLLVESSKHNLQAICLNDGKKIILEDDDPVNNDICEDILIMN